MSRLCLLQDLCAKRHRQSGSAALEAILCLIFMFAAFYTMWGAALIIYNKSKLDTATQLSAHSALIIMDRAGYRGINPDNITATAYLKAYIVARNIYKENSCGMLPDQFIGEVPDTGCGTSTGTPPGFNFRMRCTGGGALVLGEFSAFDYNGSLEKCISGGYHDAQYMEVTITGQATSPFTLMSPLLIGQADSAKENIFQNITSRSRAFSAGGGQ